MNKIIKRYNRYYKLINIYYTDDDEEEWLPNLDEFYEVNDYDCHYIDYGNVEEEYKLIEDEFELEVAKTIYEGEKYYEQ